MGYNKELICKSCGGKFTGYANRKYCSSECARLANNKMSERVFVCEHCGVEFKTRHYDQRFCSPDCWNKHKTNSNTVEKHCVECGKGFRIKRSRDQRYNVSYCSMECYGDKKKSSYEYDLIDEIKKFYGGEIKHGYRPKFMDGKEIDIFIPEFSMGLEINGLYWHSEISGLKDRDYHTQKSKLCLENGIKLIHIFTDELDNNMECIVSRLAGLMGFKRKTQARMCDVREVDNKEAKTFLDKHHTQGNVNSPIRFGLYYKDELISIMTFCRPRRVLGNRRYDLGEYELLRYASSMIVVGGFNKLIKAFQRKYSPKKIISYMDLRWSPDIVNNVYTRNGFEFVHKSIPNFWYTKDFMVREHRFKYRKSELVRMGFDKSKSERQIMEDLGYDRVYDCGSAKYEMIL